MCNYIYYLYCYNSIINKCHRDSHYKYFHTFNYECVYDINFKNITNNEIGLCKSR